MYRPTYNSKKRTLSQPFEQVNEEQLVKRIYNIVSPVDTYYPTNLNIQATVGQVIDFRVKTPSPQTNFLKITWGVNGIYRWAGNSYALNTSSLNAGNHTVSVKVIDPTLKVRNDPGNLLSETVNWSVNITQ